MMTNGLFTILLIVVSMPAFAQQVTIDSLRYLYFDEWVDECGAEKLVEYTEGLPSDAKPVFQAYRGAGLATTANCTSWPLAKMSRFRDGKALLEDAVEEVPQNLEVRFIRYTIQKNIPGFLNYDNLEEDRKFILDGLTLQLKSGKKDELAVRILKYFNEMNEFTKEEIQELESVAPEE
jgi:hypothetical protein